MNKVKPMLMQLAEPEYMCPECGFKFYLILSDERIINYFPSHCSYCNKEFSWKDNQIEE